jgi:outer membrane receptor for ferrienterochelin and colicin
MATVVGQTGATGVDLGNQNSSTAPELEGDALFQEMLNVESQLQALVTASTHTSLRASQTPAVVTVVTAEEIQARGLVDLAGVLRTVPGFYGV